jgi:expansin (peptidoglycan-binding protein)
MRATFGAVLLVLGILVSSELSAFGQSEPSTTYTFNNLTSGFRTTPFGGYKADDFFLGAINTDLRITWTCTIRSRQIRIVISTWIWRAIVLVRAV